MEDLEQLLEIGSVWQNDNEFFANGWERVIVSKLVQPIYVEILLLDGRITSVSRAWFFHSYTKI